MKNNKRSGCTFFTCVLWALLSLIAPSLHAGEVIISNPDFDSLALGLRSDVLEDPSGILQFAALQNNQHPWRPLGAKDLPPQFTSSAFWLRVSLLNQTGQSLNTILDSGSVLVDYLDFYVVRSNGSTEVVLTGDRRPFHSRQGKTRTVSQPLEIGPGERVTIFMRQTTHDGLHETLTPTLRSPEAHDAQLQKDGMVFGFLFGTLGALMLYNLFLAVFTRQPGFLRYVLLTSGILAWGFVFRGYAFQYLWPNSPDLNNQILAVIALLSHAAFSLFAIGYLNVRQLTPRWLYLANWIPVALNSLLIILPLLGYYALSFASWFVAGTLTQIIVVATNLLLIRQGSGPARFFIVAYAALGAGTTIYYLHLLGLMAPNFLTEYGIQIGASLQVLLLGIGLADQMNTLKAEKLKAEQTARSAQLALNSKLTEEVRLRTMELEDLNHKLSELSITDELTGCFNRRHFNQVLEEELAHHQRQDCPLAFCMFDLDNFKTYNDTHGHQAGDRALQQVSHHLHEVLKRKKDLLFRLGGEEFGVLLNMDQPIDKAVPFVEQLRQAIADLGIPHKANPDGVITASFGLIMLKPGSAISTPTEIYARADALLYQAKSEGRNQVAYAID
ncbi:diguanylate cyclase [Marinobacter sp. F4216]|uniref:sensor domain-containing diguanylate cyclase n=1 Tax=Marinobacter sp. F4216 TaxID=2874281 RepID=UPI001CBB9764|nr:diguanylate cyclase [Marinobacter sp. F4216]MBZ2167658.1 sensor domain-containing diguanylate cyclase [Marinobacter sp. F4216]